MSEDVSRRKMLSLLGLGAALGFTLSATLEPLVAEAQEAAPATPNPTAPATGSAPATGTRGRNSADIATRHSPSAAERAPWSPCDTRCNSSSSPSAIAIGAGDCRKQKGGPRAAPSHSRPRSA